MWTLCPSCNGSVCGEDTKCRSCRHSKHAHRQASRCKTGHVNWCSAYRPAQPWLLLLQNIPTHSNILELLGQCLEALGEHLPILPAAMQHKDLQLCMLLAGMALPIPSHCKKQCTVHPIVDPHIASMSPTTRWLSAIKSGDLTDY